MKSSVFLRRKEPFHYTTVHSVTPARRNLLSRRYEYKDLQSARKRITDAYTQCSRIANPPEQGAFCYFLVCFLMNCEIFLPNLSAASPIKFV